MVAAHRMSFPIAWLLYVLFTCVCAINEGELLDNFEILTDAAIPSLPGSTLGDPSKAFMALGGMACLGGILLLLCGERFVSQHRDVPFASPIHAMDSETAEDEDEKSWCSRAGPFSLISIISFAAVVVFVWVLHANTLSKGNNNMSVPSLDIDNSVDAQYEHARLAFESDVYGKPTPSFLKPRMSDLTPVDAPPLDYTDGSSLKRFSSKASSVCPNRRPFPPPPSSPLQYNGIEWPEMCVEDTSSSHFFIMGDYGGITCGDVTTVSNRDPNGWTCKKTGVTEPYVKAADNTHDHGDRGRYMLPSDTHPQHLVAEQMSKRYPSSQPRYVVNGGDNFYFGGLDIRCGVPMSEVHPRTRVQYKYVFEQMYAGVDVPFFSVFGNHDFGGRHFNAGWDQEIAYTWAHNTSGRWIQPGFYWSQKVNYPSMDFSVEYFMFDSNKGDAKTVGQDAAHNICGTYNDGRATCAMAGGPSDRGSCHLWFDKLWKEQSDWLEMRLKASTARWKVLVTHFPPDQFMGQYYKNLRYNFGVDLFIGSHRHSQELHVNDRRFGGLNWMVVGGGGGITSEWNPDESSRGRNQYGFMDVQLSKNVMTITMVNERGSITHSSTIKPLVNTPKVMDDVYKTEKWAAGKASEWLKADEKAKEMRAWADKATQEKEDADMAAQEKEEAEKGANDALEAAKTAAEAATAAQGIAESIAKAKADLLRHKESEGADPAELEQVAVDKTAAEKALSEKKEATQAAWRAVSNAEKESGKAHREMLQATKTSGFKEANEKHALDAAAGAEEYAQKAETEKKAAETELASKKAALKT